jgi:cation/acetate symporter
MSQYIQANQASQKQFFQQLKKYYGFYTIGFITFLVLLAIAEQMGMSRKWIGYWFLFATIALYAGIGIMARTVDAAEYYVAGGACRRSSTAWRPARTG